MSAFTRPTAKHAAFTLVELATVIAIVAVLTGTTLVLGSKRIEQQKVEDTKKRIAMIEKAIQNYANVNQTLPCPADPFANRTEDTFGLGVIDAAVSPPVCDSDNLATDGANMRGGVVPVITLGLPKEAAYDAWGRKIAYYVDQRAAATTNFMSLNGPASTCGSITINDESGNAMKENVLYVVLSSGADGHGAYLDANTNTRMDAGNTNASTLANANTLAVDATFASHAYVKNAAAPDAGFDDVIRFKSRRDLQLGIDKRKRDLTVSNIPIEAGWVYVPDYTLPDGTFVPGFKTMKYEAEDALPSGADNIADAPSGTTTPANLRYPAARQACQAIGTGTTATITGKGGLMEYDIMTESQWLSIAHQIVPNARNWNGACITDDTLLMSGLTAGGAVQVAGTVDEQTTPGGNDANPYKNTTGEATQTGNQRRTMVLPSGSVIWDFVGNRSEWVYCDMNYCDMDGYADRDSFYNVQGGGNFPLTLTGSATPGGAGTESRLNSILTAQNPPNGWTHTEAMGKPMAGTAGTNIYLKTPTDVARAVARGGQSTTGVADAGPFYSIINNAQVSAGDTNGFRCVHNFRKPPTYDDALPFKSFNPNALTGLEIWYDATDIDADGIPEYDANGNGTIDDSNSSATVPTITLPTLHATTQAYLGITTNLVDNDPATCTSAEKNDGCVRVWMNKNTNNESAISTITNTAGNEREKAINNWHAVSKRLSGNASGNENNVPTRFASVASMNNKPAINFRSGWPTQQWFDIWWSYNANQVNRRIGNDDGYGYDMSGMTQFTMLFAANASEYGSLFTAHDEQFYKDLYPVYGAPWAYFMTFPYNVKLSRAGAPGTCPVFPNFGWHLCGNPDYIFMMGNTSSETLTSATDCYVAPTVAPGFYNWCIANTTVTGSYRVGACARMGGITTLLDSGLTPSNTHVGTGIFQTGNEDGMRAYVDGQMPDPQYSAISVSGAFGSSGGYCMRNPAVCWAGDSRDCANELTRLRMNLVIGRSRDGFTGNTYENFKGNVGELMVFNRALSNQERMMIERYLAAKWGVVYDGPQSIYEDSE